MDYQILFNGAFGLLAAIFGWFARTMYETVEALKSDLYTYKVQVAKDYMPKTEINQIKEELLTAMRRIEDKLERR